jgi:hypothetical protein
MKQMVKRRAANRFEAMDLAAGIYHARQLARTRYNNQDFLEFFAALEWENTLMLEDAESA